MNQVQVHSLFTDFDITLFKSGMHFNIEFQKTFILENVAFLGNFVKLIRIN